ncbi:MAG: hypothetical protein AAGI10_12030 [Pseudomonadota bacterium]
MAVRADGYSRTVRTLKVVLPLVALGLLSTLFFFSGEVDPTQSIPYAELNIDQIVREEQLSSPYFAGVTSEDTAVVLTGTAVVSDPDNDEIFTIDDVDAQFTSQSSNVLDAVAAFGTVDGDAGTITLGGGTVLTTSDGITMRTEGLITETGSGDTESLGPVDADGPFGTLNAQHMSLKRPNSNGPHRIVFTGDVKLVYVE